LFGMTRKIMTFKYLRQDDPQLGITKFEHPQDFGSLVNKFG
jgi:hypothetical protein